MRVLRLCNLGGYTYVGTKNGCVPLRLSNQAGWVVGLGKGLQVAYNGVQMDSEHWASYCHGNGLSGGGYLCKGYADSDWPCAACCEQNRIHNSAGFVESEGIKIKEMKEVFPVTITAYRGDKAFKVYGVIEDSIASKPDREGNITLSFETLQSKDEIGYIPCVDWYTTELES